MMLRILLALALAGCAPAQPMALNLTEAKRMAVQNSPGLAASRYSAEAAHLIPIELRTALAPTFAGNATLVGADSASRLAAGALNNPALYSRFAMGVSLTQLLTDFGRTKAVVESAKLRAEAQDQASETARASVVITAVRAYFAVLRGNSVLKVAERTVAARRTVAEQVAALADSKLKSGLDVSFARVNVADAELFLSQANNVLASSEAELAAALGLPGDTRFSLAEEANPEPLPDSVEALVSQALTERPEARDIKLQVSAAERFTQAEKALKYPSVSIAGATGIVPTGEHFVPDKYGAIGVNLNIPIFNGGLFKARQAEAELRAKAVGANASDLGNRIARDVRIAYLSAKTAFERVALNQQLLKQAELSLDLAQGRYDLGLSSIVELSQAQLNVTAAQIGVASATYEYQAQRAMVDYQTGALR